MNVIFEDNVLLAVNKPAGLNSDLDKQHHPCVETWAQSYLKNKAKAYLYNRIDRPSSGIVLLTKNKSALIKLQSDQHKIKKVYRVLIEKQIHPTAGKLFNYVHKDLLNKRLEVFDTFRNEKLKTAELIYETIRNTNEFTELEIILITGRYHQIRAQLAHKGFPIIGDTYYGSTKSFGGESRIALHAYKMELFHPVNGNHIFIEAPLPDYWL